MKCTGGIDMERVYFSQHKGKKFLYVDMSNCDIKEFLSTIPKAKELVKKQPEKSVLVFTDVTDAHYNSEVTDALKDYTKSNKPYVIASAVLGVNGLKQVIFNGIMRFTGRRLVMFDTKDQALNWLIEQ